MAETWDSIADWYAAPVRGGSAMHKFSRAIAVRGATVVGIDPTSGLIAHAQATEQAHPTGATYRQDDGRTLSTVNSESMDCVTAALSLNNIPDLQSAMDQSSAY